MDCRGGERGMEEEGKGRLAFTLLLIYETTTASAGRLRSQTSRLLSYCLCFSACWCLVCYSPCRSPCVASSARKPSGEA